MNKLTMRTLVAFSMLCLFLSFSAQAQRGKNWHFGNGAGLDFIGSGTPVSTNTSSMNTNEGCSSISSPSGGLLFYTDGSTVYTATGSVMPNGTGLGGHSSSTQSAIIMPSPVNPDIYLVYIADKQCGNGFNNGIQMAFVDMTLNGGLGAVTSKNNPVFPGSSATEKISATCHSNGTDYWVVAQERGSGDIYAWQVDGFTSYLPVVSPGPGNVTSCDSRVGQLKISPDGTRLAVMNRSSSGTAHLYDFNPATGVATNPRTIKSGVTYGCEFSPNSNLLYVTTFGWIYQYDATANNTVDLQNSQVPIHNTTGGQLGSVEIGPNNRLYVSNGGPSATGDFVDEIQNPDVAGTGCTYMDDIIALQPGTKCGLGLPNFAACLVTTQPCDLGNSAMIFPTQLSGCTYSFNVGTVGGGLGGNTVIVSHHWDFGDGATSSDPFPTHTYTTPGNYTVCYTVTGFNGTECCTDTYCIEGLRVEECDPCDELNPQFSATFQGPLLQLFTASQTLTGSGIYWDFGDGNTGTGNQVSHQYTVPGIYNVCITEIFTFYEENICCTRTYCEKVNVDEEPGARMGNIDEEELLEPDSKEGFTIFPNPTQSNASVAFKLDNAQRLELTLLDLRGKVVKELLPITKMEEGQYEVSFATSDLPAGLYFVNMTSEGGNYTKRISVVK